MWRVQGCAWRQLKAQAAHRASCVPASREQRAGRRAVPQQAAAIREGHGCVHAGLGRAWVRYIHANLGRGLGCTVYMQATLR